MKQAESQGTEDLTIDGDSNSLRESKAVLANESRDLAKTAGSLVLSSRLAELNLRDLEVEVVGLRDRLDGDGAGVVLRRGNVSNLARSLIVSGKRVKAQATSTYRVGEKGAESHLVKCFSCSTIDVRMKNQVGEKQSGDGVVSRKFLFKLGSLGELPLAPWLSKQRWLVSG